MAGETTDDKRKRHRSPAYPSLGLKAAVAHIHTIYKSEKRTSAPVGVVAELCGVNISGSAGLRLIAALKQYGFLVEEGSGDARQVRLSERALDIELGTTDAQKADSIKAAALAPPIHRKVWDKFGGEMPSDATIRAYLLRELDFNDVYVGRFIKQFRGTLAYAGLTESDKIGDADGDDADGSEVETETPRNSTGKNVTALTAPKDETAVVRDFPIPLVGGGLAVIKVPVPMSAADFKQITGTLKAWKSALVRQAQGGEQQDDDEDDDDSDLDDDQ